MDEPLIKMVHQIADSAGIKKAAIADKEVERAIQRRMDELKITDRKPYSELIQRDKPESQELIELLVNQETWFFRDPAAFDFLIQEIVRKKTVEHPPISVFVGPCSTGEEVYSIMMKLLDAGYKNTRVQIDAYDISRKAIDKAKAGVYGKRSFRGKNFQYMNKYFHVMSGNYIVHQEIKDSVQFYATNLLEKDFPTRFETYDALFCRNLLVYLNEYAREILLNHLKRLMHADSVLFVSPYEIEIVRKHGLCAETYQNKLIYFRKPGMYANRSSEQREGGVEND